MRRAALTISRGIGIGMMVIAITWLAGCAAPIVPTRSKPGGSARWGEALALEKVVTWSRDAKLCRISGAGIGADGWLPDRGGTWVFDYWSADNPRTFQVTIDSDGGVRTREIQAVPQRGTTVPADWLDSPKIWSTTRRHQVMEPVHTLDAEMSVGAEPERFPGRCVWKIRFFEEDSSFEMHVVAPDGTWLARY